MANPARTCQQEANCSHKHGSGEVDHWSSALQEQGFKEKPVSLKWEGSMTYRICIIIPYTLEQNRTTVYAKTILPKKRLIQGVKIMSALKSIFPFRNTSQKLLKTRNFFYSLLMRLRNSCLAMTSMFQMRKLYSRHLWCGWDMICKTGNKT